MEEPTGEVNIWKRIQKAWSRGVGKPMGSEVVNKPAETVSLTSKEVEEMTVRLLDKLQNTEESVGDQDVQDFGKLVQSGINGENTWYVWRVLEVAQLAFATNRKIEFADYYEERRWKFQTLVAGNTEKIAKFVSEDVERNGGWEAARAMTLVSYISGSRGEDNSPITELMMSQKEEIYKALDKKNEVRDFREPSILWLRYCLKQEKAEEREFALGKIKEILTRKETGFVDGLEVVGWLTDKHDIHTQETTREVRKLLNVETEKWGFSTERMRQLMEDNEIGGINSEEQRWWLNLQMMQQIENGRPATEEEPAIEGIPGGVERLKNEWNIELFYRYGLEYWMDMLKSLDKKEMKWVICISGKLDQGVQTGGALMNVDPWSNLEIGLGRTWLKLREHGYALRTLQVDHQDQVEKAAALLEKFGYIKADGFIIDAHGRELLFKVGTGEKGEITVAEILNNEWSIKGLCVPNPPGVSTNCLGGAAAEGEKSVVQAIGEQTGSSELDGQMGSGAWSKIDPRFDENDVLLGFDTVTTSTLVEYRSQGKQ